MALPSATFFRCSGFARNYFAKLGITLDERIADGYYYSKSVHILKHLLQHPELLEERADKEVEL